MHRHRKDWRTLVQVDDSGCWLWTGATTKKDGYGRLGLDLAHRLVYEVLVGEIAPELELDHLCRNRACVNPAHLEPVSHLENMRRAWLTHCKRGHEFTAENTYWFNNRGYPSRACRQCQALREQTRAGRGKP